MDRDTAKREQVREKDIRALHARIQRLEDQMSEELDKKKDTSVVDLEIQQLKASAGKHDCIQGTKMALMSSSMGAIEKSVQNIEDSLGRWRSIKMVGVIAIVTAVLSGAAYVIRTDSKTQAVKASVGRIEEDISTVKSQVDGMQKDTPYAERRALAVIRETIKEEMASVREGQE